MKDAHPMSFTTTREIKDAIKRAAKADSRSVSSFIEYHLLKILRDQGYLSDDE